MQESLAPGWARLSVYLYLISSEYQMERYKLPTFLAWKGCEISGDTFVTWAKSLTTFGENVAAGRERAPAGSISCQDGGFHGDGSRRCCGTLLSLPVPEFGNSRLRPFRRSLSASVE